MMMCNSQGFLTNNFPQHTKHCLPITQWKLNITTVIQNQQQKFRVSCLNYDNTHNEKSSNCNRAQNYNLFYL